MWLFFFPLPQISIRALFGNYPSCFESIFNLPEIFFI